MQRLKDKSYKPKPARKVEIPKDNDKTRPLSIYLYEDKLVQEAVKEVLGAVFEPHFYENMCGFRPNRSCHGAIRELNDMIEGQKTNYILDADISGFFDIALAAKYANAIVTHLIDDMVRSHRIPFSLFCTISRFVPNTTVTQLTASRENTS